ARPALGRTFLVLAKPAPGVRPTPPAPCAAVLVSVRRPLRKSPGRAAAKKTWPKRRSRTCIAARGAAVVFGHSTPLLHERRGRTNTDDGGGDDEREDRDTTGRAGRHAVDGGSGQGAGAQDGAGGAARGRAACGAGQGTAGQRRRRPVAGRRARGRGSGGARGAGSRRGSALRGREALGPGREPAPAQRHRADARRGGARAAQPGAFHRRQHRARARALAGVQGERVGQRRASRVAQGITAKESDMEPRHEPTTPKPDYDRAAAIMPAPDVAEEADAGHPAIAHGELRPPAQERSIPYLLRQLTDQVTTLFTKELALARSEVRHAVSHAKTGVGSVAAGALVTFGGFLVLLFAAVWALDLMLSTWLSALIVGAVTVIVGAI